jgi:hypothetical protein
MNFNKTSLGYAVGIASQVILKLLGVGFPIGLESKKIALFVPYQFLIIFILIKI